MAAAHTPTPTAGEATLVQAVRAHGGEVACLDARGARLATGGGDRALRLWRWRGGGGWTAEGEARHAHRYGVVAVRWAPGGALLASGGVDGAVRLWCGRSLGARRLLAAPGAPAVRALCWAGGRLLAGHDDGALCAWAPAAGVLLARLRPHEGALHALAAPARGALLLTACTHGVLKVFSLRAVCASGEQDGAPPAPLQWVDGAHDLGALCADASEAGAAATGGHDARVRVWLPAGAGGAEPLAAGPALEGHTAAVTALRWSLDGALLVSASLDRTARLWAPAAGACLLALAAHPRYLTCVSLAPDLRYMITGSNDKSFRTWSLGQFSLEDEMEPPCSPHLHYALGDLQGIGPVEDEGETDGGPAAGGGEGAELEGEGGSGARRVWSAQAHAGPINCVAVWEHLLATASSDGWVKVWAWRERAGGRGVLQELHAVRGGEYPALAADFGARGAVLLAAGLDGTATLYDVQSGVPVRTVVAAGGRGGEPGGGGVRGARLSPHRAPLALLATDDGLAPLWRLTDPDPHPLTVYAGHTEAVTCCAWSADGRLAATGAASGELRVLAPPHAACLHHDSKAHDLGVLSCDFAPPCPEIELEEHCYLLATGGCDSLVKLWRVEAAPGATEGGAEVRLVRAVAAHGGAVAGVRWGAGGVLATAGADAWARVWRVSVGAQARVVAACAVPVRGAGGAPAAALAAGGSLLAVGSLPGELVLWRLEGEEAAQGEEGVAPRLWDEREVARWVREYVLEAPGSGVSRAACAALEARVRGARLTGARLLDDPVEELLHLFDGAAEVNSEGAVEACAGEGEGGAEGAESAVRVRARRELQYVRAPPPSARLEAAAPHALLCPLTHRVLVWPARAADGYTYERANLAEWVSAAGAPLSPLSGRPLRSAATRPNYALLEELRAFRAHHAPDDTDALPSARPLH